MSARHRPRRTAGSDSTPRKIYDMVARYKANKEQLDRNGYPRPSSTDGLAVFHNGKCFNSGETKICSRCKVDFTQKRSEIPQGGRCFYHYGKCYDDTWTWTCCGRSKSSRGCKEEKTHVHSDNLGDPRGFVQTKRVTETSDRNAAIYAVDCEMSYTVHGRELTRVTIVDHDCNPIYDRYVKPYGEILSYNTEFSGITARHLEGVTTTLADVQEYLVNTFSADTIFVGHSLESDFTALRLIHDNVIDTALLFTHPRGHKYALRTLAKRKLGINIQSGIHDSIEDSSTCMRIILQRLRM